MTKIDLRELLHEAGKGITLSELERERLERVVVGYTEMKPIRPAERALFMWGRVEVTLRRVRKAGVLALMALVFLSGTVSYAAEGALPGDTLYGVKVSVNEEVRTALAVTPLGKAAWSVARAERRLAEAVELARAGLLTPETNAFIAEMFTAQAEQVAVDVDALEKEDASAALNVVSRFETRVAAHDKLLNDLTDDIDVALKNSIVAKSAQIAEVRAHAEVQNSVATAAVPQSEPVTGTLMLTVTPPPVAPPDPTEVAKKEEGQKGAALAANASALKQLTVAKQLFGVASPTLTAADSERVSADISAAGNAIADADALFASGNYSGAYKQYQYALQTADQLSVYLKAAFELKIRVLPVGL